MVGIPGVPSGTERFQPISFPEAKRDHALLSTMFYHETFTRRGGVEIAVNPQNRAKQNEVWFFGENQQGSLNQTHFWGGSNNTNL